MQMRNYSLTSILAAVLFFSATAAWALDENTIRLVSGNITPATDVSALVSLSAKSSQERPIHCLIQLTGVPDGAQRRTLEAAGVVLLEPIPQRAWLASVHKTLTRSQAEALGIRWGKELTAGEKQHPRVLRGEFGPWAHYEGDRVIVSVRLHADVPSEKGEEIAAAFGAQSGDYIVSLNTWIMAVEPTMIEAIAGVDAVEWVDVLPPPLTPVNEGARQATGANTVQAAPYGLDGSGITVCVYDGGMVDNTHSDLAGRVTWGESGSVADHSTHVAGSVGGSGYLSSGQYCGMAPNCQIVSYEYEACNPYCLYNSPQDIEANYQAAHNTYGAALATNSIGSNTAANHYSCTWEGDYELVSQLLDSIVRGSIGSPFIVVFAAGNERGYGTCGTGYATLGVPGGAKNIITVGATNDLDSMTYFSSWGPTDDGRIKPEVCAPGDSIYSTLPGNAYGFMSGTSMATPVTSGCIALMLQQFAISYPALTPLPSTVKALLINTAVDRGNAGPDYAYGFGRVNVQAAVDAILQGQFLEDQLSVGQTDNFTFTVPNGTPSLRVSLSWMDPAASPLSNPTLVNDLDLALISPGAATYYPFVLNPASPSTVAGTGVNHRDNSEQVLVSSPAAGVWTIHVSATSLPSGPQSYSLAASQSILPGYGWVTGVVSDAVSLDPISGAVVHNPSGPQTCTSAANGSYKLYLPAGGVTVEFSAFGYQTSTETVTVPDRGTLTQNEALSPSPTAALYGYVHDQSGTPVSGAEVRAMDTPLASAFSGPDGYYTINLPLGGTYTMKASATGFGAQQKTVAFNGAARSDFYLFSVVACYDFESSQGWTAGATDDDATRGRWERADPQGTYNGTTMVQPEDDHTPAPGTNCYVTDGRAGTSIGNYDVDGGKTTLLSPMWNLSGYQNALLDLWTWYSNDEGSAPGRDYFVIDVSSNGGTSWVNLLNTRKSWEYWKNQSWALESYISLTNQVRLRIIAQDQSSASVVEAAVDDVCLYAAVAHAPEAASHLVVRAEDNNLHLLWQRGANATSYRVERAGNWGGPWVPLDSVGAEVTDYLHVNGADSSQAFYRVIAKN
jgi:subtilisin family serine protease